MRTLAQAAVSASDPHPCRIHFDASGGDAPHLGPVWELWITPGNTNETCVGHPLNSTLADLVGCRVAHEAWPEWIDELAAEIERTFGLSLRTVAHASGSASELGSLQLTNLPRPESKENER